MPFFPTSFDQKMALFFRQISSAKHQANYKPMPDFLSILMAKKCLFGVILDTNSIKQEIMKGKRNAKSV